MEEFSNGNVEATQKVERDEEDKTGVIKDHEELKTQVESVREIVVDGNSESLEETHDLLSSDSSNSPEEEDEAKDHNLSAKDSGKLEEVEKDVNIKVESAEPSLPFSQELSPTIETSIDKSQEPDVTEEEQKEIEVKIYPSASEANEIAPVVSGALKGTNETMSPPKTLDETAGTASELVSCASSDDLSAVPVVVVSEGIEEKILPSLDENGGVPPALIDVESEGIEEAKMAALENNGEPSGFIDKGFGENIDDLSKTSKTATTVGSCDGFLQSTGNPQVISISPITPQRTSWRSCCALFEVLRRSDR